MLRAKAMIPPVDVPATKSNWPRTESPMSSTKQARTAAENTPRKPPPSRGEDLEPPGGRIGAGDLGGILLARPDHARNYPPVTTRSRYRRPGAICPRTLGAHGAGVLVVPESVVTPQW